ncbi:hypothetical protein [Rhizobium sp. CF142]|uniref:hypothetical protein n=1 Tax=Rhizobium sp. CF142 TaxID=1144314 RepID=UPI00026EFBE2|nr:hypothetical protein [Rhizobium sp. CF142]EJJ26482.1 hypothetical protein PMI11_05400 [Rhizobium sp. CF142]
MFMRKTSEKRVAQGNRPPYALTATWENRSELLAIMHNAMNLAEQVQKLWERSGQIGRISQSDTDEMVLLLSELSALSEAARQLD